MQDVVIVDAVRTPIGRAGKGSLADIRPDDLVAHAIATVVARAPGVTIDEVICGCAYPWGEQGMNVGRAATLLAGLPTTTPAHTVSRFCASSLEAIRSAHHRIALGEADAVIACGVESVSRVGRDAHLAERNVLLGEGPGAVSNYYISMIDTAQIVAEQFALTRGELDGYAQRSQQRAVAAQQAGFFDREIAPVRMPDGTLFERDEGPRPTSSIEGLAKLEPVSGPDGVITAGNACPLNDGAAAVLVMSADACRDHGLAARARVLTSAVAGVDPKVMGIGPIEAVRSVLDRAGLTIDDIDVFELNEAFASQVIAVAREVGIDPYDDRFNPFGGAIALGHPFGMTGARIMTTLLNGLGERDGTIGLETMCVGGGQGQAIVVERLS